MREGLSQLEHRIFRAAVDQPLSTAHYLGDYEALVISPDWESLFGTYTGPPPGQDQETTHDAVFETKAMFERRTAELAALLSAGGVMVVKVQPPSTMWAKNPYLRNRTDGVDTTEWITAVVPQLEMARLAAKIDSPFIVGSGREITIRELDHPLATVINEASGYSGRIAKQLFEVGDTVLLATSRIGDPIAAEISVGKGLVLLLPSGVDNVQLEAGLDEILDTRERYRQMWLLPEEAALIEEEKAMRADARHKLADLSQRAHELAEIRQSVAKGVDIARAIGYYENGTSATRPIKQAMVDLYKLVELLEGNFGGSEEALASGLAVPKSLFKHIKKLANQKELDFRHATSGETEGADAKEIEQARDDARALVQRFIEQSCAEELKRRAARPAKAIPRA